MQLPTLNTLQSRRLVATVGIWVFAGCGAPSTNNKTIDASPAQIPKPSSGGVNTYSGAAGSNCKSKLDCPPADVAVSISFDSQTNALIGTVGQPVNWSFVGVDKNTANIDNTSSTRQVMVLLNQIPKGAAISPEPSSGQLASTVQVNWTPGAVASGIMDVIARDYELCVVNESEAACNQYNFLEKYDKRLPDPATPAPQVKWMVGQRAQANAQTATPTTGSVVNVANPNCGPAATSTGQIAGNAVQSAIMVLMPGGIVNLIPGLVTGLINSGSQPQKPTQC